MLEKDFIFETFVEIIYIHFYLELIIWRFSISLYGRILYFKIEISIVSSSGLIDRAMEEFFVFTNIISPLHLRFILYLRNDKCE